MRWTRWFSLILFASAGWVQAASGFQVVYQVTVKGPVPVTGTETVTVCGDRMRMVLADGRELLFDRSIGKAWDVRRSKGLATEYDMKRNRPFFDRFLVPFAAVTGEGALIFPENIFLVARHQVQVHGKKGMEVVLPGHFLQSRSTAVLPMTPGKLNGDAVADFYGFFSRNRRFLDQVRTLKGFPLRLSTIVNLNGTRTVTDRDLQSAKPVPCDGDSLSLPKGLTVRSAPPEGVPLMAD